MVVRVTSTHKVFKVVGWFFRLSSLRRLLKSLSVIRSSRCSPGSPDRPSAVRLRAPSTPLDAPRPRGSNDLPFKQLPVYINSSLPSQTRKLRNLKPRGLARSMPPTLPFRCSRAYRTIARPEWRLKALPVARKNGHFFFYRSCVHVFFQCKKMRNGMTAMRLFAGGCLFEDLREAIGSQRSRR